MAGSSGALVSALEINSSTYVKIPLSMKKFAALLLFLLPLASFFSPDHAHAAESAGEPGYIEYLSGAIAIQLTGAKMDENTGKDFAEIASDSPMSLAPYLAGRLNKNGEKQGLLPMGGQLMAKLYQQQPSSREYAMDILDNIGIPSVSRAYAQGTGYSAMTSFLPFWKVFRNLAYSLYIIMFVVVGVMIMLRTKVNAQTIITIQSALPNLLITLLLITFSYAIVGFMIDLMYFLIYFVVYLLSSPGINIISTPTVAISRLLNYSAWSVLFEGRNSIVSAISLALGDILSGLGTGGLEALGTVISWVTPMYLVVAVYLAINMIKLMFALVKSYIMLIVQTVTAPVQILMNAMPGSKAFSDWLKKTASYLIPFPVAAAMFIFAAVLIGDPTKSTIFGDIFKTGSANPFGINSGHEFYSSYDGLWKNGTGADSFWLPPFTLTGDTDVNQQDIMTLLGFVIFCMTPSVVKMAQEWLQIKESPYASEALQGFVSLGQTAVGYPMGLIKQGRSLAEQKRIQEYGARKYAEEAAKFQKTSQPPLSSA